MPNGVVVVPKTSPVAVNVGKSNVLVGIRPSGPIDVEAGYRGKPGPRGPEGGTPVVALPYNEWPPVDPQPDTLYLRLAP